MRYFTPIDGILECFCTNGVSTIAVLDHNRKLFEFASALQTASQWFLNVEAGEVKPTRSVIAHGQRGRHVPLPTPTHCPHGHEYTPDNTYRRADRRGIMCKTYTRARSKEFYSGHKEAP